MVPGTRVQAGLIICVVGGFFFLTFCCDVTTTMTTTKRRAPRTWKIPCVTILLPSENATKISTPSCPSSRQSGQKFHDQNCQIFFAKLVDLRSPLDNGSIQKSKNFSLCGHNLTLARANTQKLFPSQSGAL